MTADIDLPLEMRQKYLLRRSKDLEALRVSSTQRSLEEFIRIGHQLKGNAASFGYSDLEKIAIAMEAAAKKKDFVEANRQLDLFEKWFSEQSEIKN